MTNTIERALRRARTLFIGTAAGLSLLAGGARAAAPEHGPAAAGGATLEATLDNGMRVVIVRNSLAPVVTVEMNFMVGGNETPPAFPAWPTPRSTWPFAAAPA